MNGAQLKRIRNWLTQNFSKIFQSPNRLARTFFIFPIVDLRSNFTLLLNLPSIRILKILKVNPLVKMNGAEQGNGRLFKAAKGQRLRQAPRVFKTFLKMPDGIHLKYEIKGFSKPPLGPLKATEVSPRLLRQGFQQVSKIGKGLAATNIF